MRDYGLVGQTATEAQPDHTITSVIQRLGLLAEHMGEVEDLSRAAADKVGGGIPHPANTVAGRGDAEAGAYTLGQLEAIARIMESRIQAAANHLHRLHKHLG